MSDRKTSPDSMRSLPSSEDAESGILSCFLHDPKLLGDSRGTIPPSWFYHPARRMLYEQMLDMDIEGLPVEYIGLSQRLHDKGLMARIGGDGVLAELLDFVPAPTHYNYHRGILRDKALLRDILALCSETEAAVHEFQSDVPALLGATTERFFALTKQHQSAGRATFRDILTRYVETWEDRMAGRIDTGIPTRWQSFNQTFGGITPRLWLIAGFPSDGKSALLQNMIEDTLAHGKHVLWFSYEMDEIEVTDRLVTARTGLDSQVIFFPQNGVNRGEAQRITRAIGEMQAWGLHLRCEANWSVEQIVSETRALCPRPGPDDPGSAC